ncbi:MAG: VOC family protein [Rhodospirillaceae bacterium]|nr:VOC family protein [Rhodospirillaceae bacterium]
MMISSKIFLSLSLLALVLFMGGASIPAQAVDLSERRGLQEMVVSVKFLDRAIEMYKAIAGWEVAYRGAAPTDQAIHWGVPADTLIEQAVLRVPGSEKGYLRLVKFLGTEQVRIRSSARPFDTGAIFNFNTLVKDLEGVFEDMRDHGFSGFADPTYYTIFGKSYGGAMLRGHDGVVINLLYRVDDPYADVPPFTKMSHVVNATQMVDDYAVSLDFFQNKMGWHVRWEASPTWPEDGSSNMSIPNNLLLEGKVTEMAASFIFDPDADGGSIEIFNFTGVSGADFSHRAHPPNLGVLMYRVHVPDLETYVEEIAENGVKFARPMKTLPVALYGQVKSAIVKAPSGAWIELFEQQSAPL